MHPTQQPVADETATTACTLRDAAAYLARHGWCQGAYYDPAATVFTPAACMLGAVAMVCYGGPVDAPALNYDDPGWADFDAAECYLDGYLTRLCGLNSYEFNDTKGRTADEVIAALEAAADAVVVRHADYPHQPGTLYDCPACEADCFCADGFVCVCCAISAEHAARPTGGGA